MPEVTAYTYLGIYGDFDPHEFAARIPLLPSLSTPKHSRKTSKGLPIPPESSLHYGRQESFSVLVDVGDLAEKTVKIIEPYGEFLTAAIRAYDAEAQFSVVVYFPLSEAISTPILGFSKRVVAFIAAVGGHVDIDTYRR